MTTDMAVVTPLNNFLGPEGDTVTVDEQLLNTEYNRHLQMCLTPDYPESTHCQEPFRRVPGLHASTVECVRRSPEQHPCQ